MSTTTITNIKQVPYIKQLEKKSALLDELLELIEDKYLGYLMEQTEEEQTIPLLKFRKVLI